MEGRTRTKTNIKPIKSIIKGYAVNKPNKQAEQSTAQHCHSHSGKDRVTCLLLLKMLNDLLLLVLLSGQKRLLLLGCIGGRHGRRRR